MFDQVEPGLEWLLVAEVDKRFEGGMLVGHHTDFQIVMEDKSENYQPGKPVVPLAENLVVLQWFLMGRFVVGKHQVESDKVAAQVEQNMVVQFVDKLADTLPAGSADLVDMVLVVGKKDLPVV